MTQERAVLAGGCFWGMQDLIRRHDGVISTRVGYTGGDVPNATYRRLRHSRARRTTSTAASSSAYRAGHGTGTLFPSGFRLVRNFSELQAPPGPFHRQQCIPRRPTGTPWPTWFMPARRCANCCPLHQRQSYLEKPRPGSGEADPALIR
jgi:hypothetical protein